MFVHNVSYLYGTICHYHLCWCVMFVHNPSHLLFYYSVFILVIR